MRCRILKKFVHKYKIFACYGLLANFQWSFRYVKVIHINVFVHKICIFCWISWVMRFVQIGKSRRIVLNLHLLTFLYLNTTVYFQYSSDMHIYAFAFLFKILSKQTRTHKIHKTHLEITVFLLVYLKVFLPFYSYVFYILYMYC